MRSSIFVFLLLTTAVAMGQAAPSATPAMKALSGGKFKFNISPSGQISFHPAQTMLAQNVQPALPLYSGPANAKPQQIPTQWPNAKFELIPTQWPNARVVLVGGAAHVVMTGGSTAAAQGGATVTVQAASSVLQQKPQK